jgi:hypothetical protein
MPEFIDPFDNPKLGADAFVDPFDGEVIPDVNQEKVDNSPLTVIKDIGKLFITPAVVGFNALGYGAAGAATGTGILDAAMEGAASDEFLGFKTSADSGAGKYVEEKLGQGLEAVREFSGNQAVDSLKEKGIYSVLNKMNPLSNALSTVYKEASPDVKQEIEAIAFAGGSAAPETILTMFGGGKANSALKKGKGLTEADVLATIDEAEAPVKVEPTPDVIEKFNPEAIVEEPTVMPENALEFEKVDPASLRTNQAELPFNENFDANNIDFTKETIEASPEQVANTMESMAAQFDLPGINMPVGQTGFGKGQRGSVTLPARKELSPEQKAKKLNLEEFTQDFTQRHPQYADRPEVAQQVYQRLNNPVETSFSFKKAIENSDTLKSLDKGLGVVSTRVGNISQPILHRMIRYEKNLLQNTHTQIGKVDDFVTDLNKLDKPTQNLMNSLILNNKTEAIGKLAKSVGKPELIEKYGAVRKTLDDIGADLKSIGRVDSLREDYFPRIVTDLEGLKTTLGSTVKSALEVRLDDARKKAASNGTAFGPLEESAIVDSFMRNRGAGNKPGFTKERKLDDVAPDLEKFYASPTESLHTYIRNAISEVETARLFGKDAIRDANGRVNIEKSIGTMTAEKLRSGEITGKQAIELEGMLKSRLGSGNIGSKGLVQDIKNISNMGLLGNVMSAITQGGDIISSAYLNGFRPTMMALVSQIAGKSKVNMKDFGLIDHISEEFVSTRSTAKALNKVFDASFFSAIDRMGKNTILNGALLNGQRMVRSPKGLKEFANKWEKRFGDEFPQLVDDLQNGRKTELTDMYTFSTLSKIQPITKIELPQKYLDMPNGRIIYMLKSFMIKQMDLFRNEAYNKIKEGKTREGLYNLSKLIMVLGIGNATTQYIKDYLFSQFDDREVEFDTNIPMNVLKTFGWSEFTADKVKEGKVGEAIGGMVLPPYKMFDILMEDSIKEMDGDEETEASGKALNFIPVVGKLLYAWSEKGQEALERRQAQEQLREEEE